jgi:flotillin
MGPTNVALIVAGGVLFVVFIFIIIWSGRYVKVGPNEVLVVSGRAKKIIDETGVARRVGFRLVQGGGTFVWPIIERYDVLSLELLTLEPRCENVYTVQGVPVTVNGVAQTKVKGDEVSITTAAEQFLSKGRQEVHRIALETLEGHLRAILGMMTVEEIYKSRDAFAQRVQDVAAGDMANMGLGMVSFTIKEISDPVGYLEALGKPRIAEVQRDAIIAKAEADRDATVRSAQASQVGEQAKYAAGIQVAQAKRDYEMKAAEFQASVNQKKADADLAYDLQRYKTSQAVKREEVQVEIVAKEMQTSVQEKEIERKARELQATVERPADAERYRVRTLAEAEQYRLQATAVGRAEASKSEGFAAADVEKAKGFAEADVRQRQGLAQAEVTKATGFAEAEAMQKKADSWQAYNEAAIIQIVLEKLPQIAAAIAEPLSKTEKIVIVNSGGEGGAGAAKITKDVAEIIAQVPTIVEALSGMNLKDLISKLPGLAGKQAPSGRGGGTGKEG